MAGTVSHPLKVFVLQPHAPMNGVAAQTVGTVLDTLLDSGADVLTGAIPHTPETIRSHFEASAGARFSLPAFRAWRLGLLARAHAMVVVRTESSEFGAFEIGYNSAVTRRPMFLAVDTCAPAAPVLHDLDALCPTTHQTFADPLELVAPLRRFLTDVGDGTESSPTLLAKRLEELRITMVTGMDAADPMVGVVGSAMEVTQELLLLVGGIPSRNEVHDAVLSTHALVEQLTSTAGMHTEIRPLAAH